METLKATHTQQDLSEYKISYNVDKTITKATYLKVVLGDHTARCTWRLDQINIPPISLATKVDICNLPYVEGYDNLGQQTYTAQYRMDGSLFGESGTMRL